MNLNQGEDFAIICLDQPVEGITPVQLNSDPKIPVDGSTLEVFGWGRTQTTPNEIQRPDLPQTADLEYITNEEAQALRPPFTVDFLSPTIMFAEDPTQSTCRGDSGKNRLLLCIKGIIQFIYSM